MKKKLPKIQLQLPLLARILRAGWQARPVAMATYFVAACFEICGFLVSLYASSKLAAELASFASSGTADQVWFWFWVDVAAITITTMSYWCMNLMQRLIYFKVSAWSSDKYITALNRMDIPDFYDKDMRTRINKVQGSFEWQIANLLCYGLLEAIYALMRLLVTAIVVAQIAWWILPLLVAFLLPGMFIEKRIAKLKWGIWNTKSDDKHIFYGLTQLVRNPKNQMELRSSQARNYVSDRINAINQRFYKKQEISSWKAGKFMPIAKIAEVLGSTISLVVLLKQFLGGIVSFDRYLFLSGAVMRLSGALNQLFSSYNGMQDGLLFGKDYFEIIDYKPTLVDHKDASVIDPSHVPEIIFDNVSFTYPGQEKPTFEGLSFSIKPGEHIAIVGENGAGKSTLIKLLMRFYTPDTGHILIDGKDLQKIKIESWYKHLATLFQDFNHYPFSVRENIEIGQPLTSGDDSLLRQATEFSNITEQLENYEHGLETVLDPSFKKGTEPSGGQWQRVALARVFYRQANIIVLDEPTAAIDSKAEYDIFNNIFNHYKDKTAIIVSHRFSTVRRASTIFVIDAGKIVEQGSHGELMKIKGLYHELFTKQAEGYKD